MHRKIALIVVELLLTNILASCGWNKPEDIRQVIVKNTCWKILNEETASKDTKELARKTLSNMRNWKVDSVPILIHAGYLIDHGKNCDILFLTMADEDYDIEGIVIKEYHNDLADGNSVIEELYPLFMRSAIGHFQFVRFKERINNERKNEEEWKEYEINGKWGQRKEPTVWLSIPDPPSVKVEIYIYDHKGNVSNTVPLRFGLPSDADTDNRPPSTIRKIKEFINHLF